MITIKATKEMVKEAVTMPTIDQDMFEDFEHLIKETYMLEIPEKRKFAILRNRFRDQYYELCVMMNPTEAFGYGFLCRFYKAAFHFAEKLYGKDNIISAVMHADELNIAMTEKYGRPIYHYHLHIMALPVVDKEVRWTKRCKDPELVGKVKEVIHQVSHSKKWKSEKAVDEDGNPILNSKGKQV